MRRLSIDDRIQLELKRGDVARQQDIDAVVNAANAQLKTGGGVAGAIHRAAGPGLEEETKPLAPIKPGEAVITGAHDLPNRYVIHCLGPVYGRDKPENQLLARCYKNVLHIADQNEVESLAFPAISTGAFGYPVQAAAQVAFRTIKDTVPNLSSVTFIRVVLWSEDDLDIHKKVLQEVFEDK